MINTVIDGAIFALTIILAAHILRDAIRRKPASINIIFGLAAFLAICIAVEVGQWIVGGNWHHGLRAAFLSGLFVVVLRALRRRYDAAATQGDRK